MTQTEYLKLSLGFLLTMITTPLLGLVDTAMMGHLDDPAYIGGVAVGALVFSTLYWLFGFLRVSTIAFTAQALGNGCKEELVWAVLRPIAISLVVSGVFVIFQIPILESFLFFIKPEEHVALLARQYFYVLIWGAPFVLVSYVCTGWLMGLTKLRVTLIMQIFINAFNLLLTFLFVMVFKWGVYGVASATLIAQIVLCLVSVWAVWHYGEIDLKHITMRNLFDKSAFRKIMIINGDLMVRTICLLIMTNLFTATGAKLGTEMLAANAILFQLQYLIGNFIDGFANASSVVSGQALGKKDIALYKTGIKLSIRWAVIMIVVLTVFYLLFDKNIIRLFTKMDNVIALADRYSFWMAIYPLSYAFNTVFYGILNGVTWSDPVRNSTVAALGCFLFGIWFLVPLWGNDGLWASFTLFNCCRSLYLSYVIHTAGDRPFEVVTSIH
ncbi:MAG TPA: MATE family efflux transporter [Candidatus Avacidaminococcus intestinavium]|uniref:Probable multidrug resistance protein NorM n=1 Tax=Candidatus Avacidaminococcus intestinavium TaxID=2840684 RepID=A0A9D1MPZ7_9FIRM|nr:MATE family efflux transporter [Candidatus Avacidaminococcus intestinavium]